MPKFVRWVGLVFGLAGLALIGGGLWSWIHNNSIAKGGIRTEGIVIDLQYRSDDKGSGTYAPVVEFLDEQNRPHEYRASSGSNPPRYSRGDRVEIIYLQNNPEHALIDDFSDRWALPIFLLVFGGAFAAGGSMVIWLYVRRRRIIARLKQVGMPISAQFVECYRDTSIKVNGRSPWRVSAQAKHPLTGKLASFTSDPVWVDLSNQLSGRAVRVLIDLNDAKRHYIDLSDYVAEDT